MEGRLRQHRIGMSAERHRALRLLAGSPLGVTEAIMLAHGFTTDLLIDLGARRVGDGDARDRACWQAADRGCPGADHRCRTAGAGRMMVAGPASCARTPSMRILRQRAIQPGAVSGASAGLPAARDRYGFNTRYDAALRRMK